MRDEQDSDWFSEFDDIIERHDALEAKLDELKLSKEAARRAIWILASKFNFLLFNLYDRQDIADSTGIELTDQEFDEFLSQCDCSSDAESALLELVENEVNDFLTEKEKSSP